PKNTKNPNTGEMSEGSKNSTKSVPNHLVDRRCRRSRASWRLVASGTTRGLGVFDGAGEGGSFLKESGDVRRWLFRGGEDAVASPPLAFSSQDLARSSFSLCRLC